MGAAGFESVYASEVVAAYARTYGENHPSTVVGFGGGSTLHAIVDALGDLVYGADVRILGAPPYYGVP